MSARAIHLIVVFFVLAGCTIEQKVQPIALTSGDARNICIVENPAVRSEFLDAYERALSQKGFTVQRVPEGSAVGTCPLTTTYTADWNWDMTLYVTFVDLKVYHERRLAGEAIYDSRKGGLNLNKFIKAQEKLNELTNQLFPS